jgi:hypothetical protein
MQYSTNLFVYNFDKRTSRLIKNFYCFDNFIQLSENSTPVENIPGSNEEKIKQFDFYLFRIGQNNPTQKEFVSKYLNSIFENDKDSASFNLIFRQITNEKEETQIKKNLIVLSNKMNNRSIMNASAIAQSLDIMPTVLFYLNYRKPFIAYGKSLFSNQSSVILSASSKESYHLFMGNLLLNCNKNGTNSLKLLKNSKFSDFDYKDSLVMEKIQMENIFRSIGYDFLYRLSENNLNTK